MSNITYIPLEQLNYLDQVSFKIPYQLYSSKLSEEIVSSLLVIISALSIVVIGSYSTLARSRNALEPNEDMEEVWDPSDNDNSSYVKSTKMELELLNFESISFKHALSIPFIGGTVLYLLNYGLKMFDREKLMRGLNWYILFVSIFPVYSTLNYMLVWVSRRLTHLVGKNSSSLFTRYRLSLAMDRDNYPLGAVEGISEKSFNKDKAWFKKFKKHLQANQVTILKPTEVKKDNQLVNWIFDLKCFMVFPLSVSICYLFYAFNPNLKESYPLRQTNWLVLDIISANFAIFGIKQTKLSSFKIGFLLLAGLFFYDIYFVFGTKIMINVATGLDVPIKLVIPQKPVSQNYWEIPMSLLGLGDIVIPGSMISLCLRFDLFNHHKQPQHFHHLSHFNKPYFVVAVVSYIIGLCLTLLALNVYHSGQPALLYIVPSLLVGIVGLSLLKGEFKQLWAYCEDIEEFKDTTEDVSTDNDETDEDDKDYSYNEPNDSYDEWEAKVELKRSEGETDLDELINDQIIYEFGETDEENDDTFVIESESESDDDFSDDDITNNELDLLHEDVKSEAKEWYSEED